MIKITLNEQNVCTSTGIIQIFLMSIQIKIQWDPSTMHISRKEFLNLNSNFGGFIHFYCVVCSYHYEEVQWIEKRRIYQFSQLSIMSRLHPLTQLELDGLLPVNVQLF